MKVLQQVTIINKAVEYPLNRAKMENDHLAVFNNEIKIGKLMQKSFLNAFLAAFNELSDFTSGWLNNTGFEINPSIGSETRASANELNFWLSGIDNPDPMDYVPPMSNDIIVLDNVVYHRVLKAFDTLGINYEFAELKNKECGVVTTWPTERSKIDYIIENELQKVKVKDETPTDPFGKETD